MVLNLASSPEKVKTAVKLLYLSLVMGIFESVIDAQINMQIASPSFVIFITIFVLGIMWLNIFLISRGRNWARITFLVLFIIGFLFFVLPQLHSLPANPITGLLGLGQTVIQTVAIFFLFHKTSTDWFREMKAEN